MKRILIEKCIQCPHLIDYDDPPSECEKYDLKVNFPHGGVHSECGLDDQPPLNIEFEEWSNRFFPQIRKEWEIYLENRKL